MRIVQLANLVTPTSGGIRTCLEQLGTGYLRRGHERVVVVPGPRPAVEHRGDGTRWLELPGRRLPGSGGYRLLTDRSHLRATLEMLQPDAIEVHDRLTLPWVVAWAQRRGLPATLVVHERLATPLRTFGRLGPLAEPIERALNRRLLRHTGGVVVASRYAAAGFAEDPRVEVIPLGVDRDRFRPTRVLGADDRPHDGLRLVLVSRLSAEKRPALAIEVSRILAARGIAHRLDVVGDGPMRTSLARRASGLPVTLHGAVPHDRVATFLSAADLALVPCAREAFGLAALEALACGTSIVTADTGAVAELLGPGAGGVATLPAGATSRPEPGAMADAVQALAAVDEPLRRAAALDIAARYDWDTTVSRFLARHVGPRPRASGRMVHRVPR